MHVPYKGSPQGILAVMSGAVKLKALGVTSLTRSQLLPQLPTLDESGVKGYEVNTWFGFVVPAGTPPDVVNKLHAEIGKVISLPAVREKLSAQGFDLAPLQPPSAFAQLIRDDMAKWPAIVKASGARVD